MIKYIVILFLFPASLYAINKDSVNIEIQHDILQELNTPGTNGGSVKLECAPDINNLLNLHIQLNKKHNSFPGYRIQIYSSTSLQTSVVQLRQMRDNFEKEFPDIPAYLKYFDPDFKIRVGNFRSRLDCIPALHRIKKKYPSSYPVKTDITLNELKRVPMQDLPLPEEIIEIEQ